MIEINKDFLIENGTETKIVFFDIETFPEWWSIVFRHRGKNLTVTSNNIEEKAAQFHKIIESCILVSYNGKNFDMRVLHAIKDGHDPEDVYEVAMAIIENGCKVDNMLLKKYMGYSYWNKFMFIDVINDLTGSLKEHESNMGLAIIESNVPFGKCDLTEEEIKELLLYNVHDVVALEALYMKRLNSYLEPKIILADLYGVDLIKALKSTNAKLVSIILGAKKLDKIDLIDRPYELPGHIKDYVNKYVDKDIVDTYLTTNMGDIGGKDIKVNDFGNFGNLGKGGIHTVCENDIRITDKSWAIFLVDVGAYYPNLMIHFDFLSRAVRDRTIFPKILAMKPEAKKSGDKKKEKAVKLTLVTTFGASGNKWNDLYDPNNAWSVTITGQLLLYALSNDLYTNIKCKIIQDNTDGIMIALPIHQIDAMKEIVSNWEKMTNLEMDYERVKIMAQRDVNNYTCKFDDGSIKTKGSFCFQALNTDDTSFERQLLQNWDMRITHEAVVQFLLNRVPIKDTIMSCKDLMMFISTVKAGPGYKKVYHEVNGKLVPTQKINRVIAVKSSKLGTIKKMKMKNPPRPKGITAKDWKLDPASKIKVAGYDKAAKISNHVHIMNNDMSTYDWDTWEKRIDFQFYIDVAKDKVAGFMKKRRD